MTTNTEPEGSKETNRDFLTEKQIVATDASSGSTDADDSSGLLIQPKPVRRSLTNLLRAFIPKFFLELWVDLSKAVKLWKKYEFAFAWNKLKLAFFDNANRNVVDPFFLSLFYLLLLVTGASAAINIVREIVNASFEHSETTVLKISEHIFLNLLPIFIVFGFLNYYTKSARGSLLNANQNFVDDERSTRPMNLSKILFVSSIISYVVIKVIEELSPKAPTVPPTPVDIVPLISYGILLLMLMVYFIFLDRKKH